MSDSTFGDDRDNLAWVIALARRAHSEGLTELAEFLEAHQVQLATACSDALRRGAQPAASPFVYALR